MAMKRTRKTKGNGAEEKSKSDGAEGKPDGVSLPKSSLPKRGEAADARTKPKTTARSPSRKSAQGDNGKPETTRRKRGAVGQAIRPDMEAAPSSGERAETDAHAKEPEALLEQKEAGIAAALFNSLESFAKLHRLGRVVGPTKFDWGGVENHDLLPEMAFVSFGRWAPYRHVPRTLTWHVVPDLVVEIVRDSNSNEALGSRLLDYFKAGVSRVLVVHPRDLRVLDCLSPSEHRTLNRDQRLEGGALLPGFELQLADLAGGG
jgi:Uma2 family endonuclease